MPPASVTADHVRQMLGLADRARVVDLFDALLRGDIAAALAELRDQYDSGADPAVILTDLAEFTHFVTRVKIVPVGCRRPVARGSRARARARFRRRPVDAHSLAHLADAAQGHRRSAGGGTPGRRRRNGSGSHRLCGRSADAGRSRALARERFGFGGSASAKQRQWRRRDAECDRRGCAALRRAARRAAGGLVAGCEPGRRASPMPRRNPPLCGSAASRNLVALAADKRDLQIKAALERDVRLVHCEDGKLEIALEPGATRTLVNELSRKLSAWTNRQWMVIVSREAAARDAENAGRCAGRREKARRARRPAGAGRARALSGRRNRGGARRHRHQTGGRRRDHAAA